MGRRPAPDRALEAEINTNQSNGKTVAETHAPLTSAAVVAAASGVETAPDPFGREAKHFTETRTLHRDVYQSAFLMFLSGLCNNMGT